ncbi:MAG: FAD-dependent oxidoreductase, partial [Gemmatimonadota bacterium]
MPNSLRVAIVGSGPSGFYAAESLQKRVPGVRIDLFDRLPTPFGLVRGGVAPDHPKIKSVSRVFERTASQPGFRFLGNVCIGESVTPAELRQRYDAVIYAYGAATDRHLGIPGEHLPGSHAATEFVGWYNGHPEYADHAFDLSQRACAVIGIGNVAMDVVRILASSADHLATTDLAQHALVALRDSSLKEFHIIARRGPVQAACTTPELRELGELDGVDIVVDPRDLELDAVSAAALAGDDHRTEQNNLALLREWAARGTTGAPRRIVFHFSASPIELLGADRVEGVRLVRNRLEPDGAGSVRAVAIDEHTTVPAGLVFRSVGYRGTEIPDVPFDSGKGTYPNQGGRLMTLGGEEPLYGVYATGWIKRGPSGMLGTNRFCARETVATLLKDHAGGMLSSAGALAITEILGNLP